MERLHSKPRLIPRRKKLHRNLTPAEATLWRRLKGSKVSGRKFRRQHSVGPYIIDFYCVEERLASNSTDRFIEMNKLKNMITGVGFF